MTNYQSEGNFCHLRLHHAMWFIQALVPLIHYILTVLPPNHQHSKNKALPIIPNLPQNLYPQKVQLSFRTTGLGMFCIKLYTQPRGVREIFLVKVGIR